MSDEQESAADGAEQSSTGGGVEAAEFEDLSAAAASATEGSANLDLIRDITVSLRVELGRTDMLIAEVLAMSPGQVIELDKLAGEPLDILINDKLLARGEVVVVDDKFGVRISSIIDPRSRVKAMGSAEAQSPPGPNKGKAEE